MILSVVSIADVSMSKTKRKKFRTSNGVGKLIVSVLTSGMFCLFSKYTRTYEVKSCIQEMDANWKEWLEVRPGLKMLSCLNLKRCWASDRSGIILQGRCRQHGPHCLRDGFAVNWSKRQALTFFPTRRGQLPGELSSDHPLASPSLGCQERKVGRFSQHLYWWAVPSVQRSSSDHILWHSCTAEWWEVPTEWPSGLPQAYWLSPGLWRCRLGGKDN